MLSMTIYGFICVSSLIEEVLTALLSLCKISVLCKIEVLGVKIILTTSKNHLHN